MTIESDKSPENYFKIYPPSVDHDGVMSDTYTLVTNRFNNLFSTNKISTDVRYFHCVRDWAQKEGASFEEASIIETEMLYDPEFLFQANPIPGAVEFMKELSDRKIEVPIITSRIDHPMIKPRRFKDIHESTVAWYEKWMPFINPDDIYMQKTNEMENIVFKTWMISTLERGIHFEDLTHHAISILNYTSVQVVLLSNKKTLNVSEYPRLTQISGVNGEMPTMNQVCERYL